MADMKNRKFSSRLGFAADGVRAAWREERSFRTQATMALLLVPVMLVVQPALIWWALVIITCGLVLAAELVNTALEHLIDHLHPEIHPSIRIAKDCAAGAVLVLSVSALCVAGLMLLSVIL